MDLITVTTAKTPFEAHLKRALLMDEGIVCYVIEGWAAAEDGIRVQVPEDAVDAARAILEGVDAPEPEGDDSKLATVARFANPLDAHGASAALGAAGVDHSIEGAGVFGAGGGVSVVVREQDEAEALRVLRSGFERSE